MRGRGRQIIQPVPLSVDGDLDVLCGVLGGAEDDSERVCRGVEGREDRPKRGQSASVTKQVTKNSSSQHQSPNVSPRLFIVSISHQTFHQD